MKTRAKSAEPNGIDLGFLSTTYGIPETDLEALLDGPTTELVREFLISLVTKGQELDTLKTEKLRVDVELENTVRTSETKVKAQKVAVTKHAKEVAELRTKLNEAESAREDLSSQLEQLRSSTSGSTADTQALRQRIDTLEASNRDQLALVESKSTEKDHIATELSEQHSKLLGLRREISQLEERNQSLENAASSQKFKEQSLQQETDLLKRNNEWHASELQTRTQENAKFRKERNARIASLQRELEDSSSSLDTLKRTETNLRQRLEEIQGKADEAFARIASLEEDSTRQEQGWKAELDGSRRLAELQAQNAATHKARLHQIEEELGRTKDDAADEIGKYQAEIETERADKEQAEARVAELELSVERLEQQPRASIPGTPLHNGAFDPATPGRAASPFAVPGSSRKYANKFPFTNTEYLTKYNEALSDLEAERRRTQKLSTALDEIATEMENRGPEMMEMRAEHERLEEQVLHFSGLLEDANTNRDIAFKDVERWQGEAESRAHEGKLLRQQLRDLSSQIKMLLAEEQYRKQGLEELSADERLQIERAARGDLEDWARNESDTNQLISLRLVIYRNVSEMQEKNEQLLGVVRELGDRMEGDEARKKAAETAATAQEADELRHQVARYKDELQATATQIDSYVKERDMFRRMLQRRGDLHPDMDLQAMFGQSAPPATPQRNGADVVAQTPRSKDVEDLNKLVKEQQTFFDQYRNESSEDRKMLKDQVDALGRDKSALQAEVAHWKSQKTLSDERLQMLQANFDGLRTENQEMQKRSQQLSENAAKQDLRTQQVAEELVEARSMAESLRNESANAKAEKELWKRIESRLTEDNKSLIDERSRLNKLVTDLQTLQNERELSDSETRRRLQNRVESLETELTDTKKKLEQASDDGRKSTLRREYEESQSRTRIDDLVKSLGNVREELVAAKTTRDSLQSRVDEMKIELRSAEERAAALQPRPTSRAQPQQNGDHTMNEDEELSAEQRLALEASDLRRDLELAKNELEATRQQIEQYRAIAQGTEEELASFAETSEQYKEETDRQIAEKDARAKELQQRVDDLLNELTTTNNELSELRNKHDDSDRVLNEQKASFEAEMARLRDDAERHTEEKKLYQQDLKAQAEIAQQAQQSYEDELLKHAEAAKNLQNVRKGYNELRTEVAGVRADAEAAKASLEQNEESWSEQREKFERELDEAKRRKQDVDEQNRLLHQQMESFSSELSALRAGRAAPAVDGEERASTPSGDGNMQEVVKYLRREKEIVDVQYELSMQEARRLQQQLDYANSQLEDVRQKLAEERRQSANKLASESSTQRLAETINQLNLYRESATTLRNEAHQYREKLEEKSKELERLVADSEPLRGRVGELEGELESKDGELKLLQDDRNHWRERTQNIISKYDRVDPAELEDMKKQLAELQVEKDRLESEQGPLREQIDNFDQKLEEMKEEVAKPLNAKLENFRTQAKDQNRKQNESKREFQNERDAAVAEKVKAQRELEETKKALQEAQANAASAKNDDAEEGQVDESGDGAEKEALQARAIEAESNVERLSVEVATLQARVSELEGQISTLQAQLDNALQGEEGEVQQTDGVDTEALDNLRQELANAQQEVETLRANAGSITEVDTGVTSSNANVAEQVAQEVAKLRQELEQQHDFAKKQVEEDRDRKLEGMKAKLNQKLKEEREQIRQHVRQELIQEHSAETQKLREEYEATIAKLKEEHQAELSRLSQEGSAAVQKAADANTEVKAEPTSDPDGGPTENQILDAMKSNQRVRTIVNNNINKRVISETEKLNKTIAAKDEEISQLKEAQTNATSDIEKEELRQKLQAAEESKKEAVRLATEQESKKAKVQLSQLAMAQVKIAYVRNAAKTTPELSVGGVWEEADKQRPQPKPAPGQAVPSSPAVAAPKPSTDTPVASAQPSSEPSAQSQDLTEEEKIRQRQQRFGTGSPTTSKPPTAGTSTFGRPSAAPSGLPTAPTTGTFGRPSQAGTTGSLAQPPRRQSMTSNTGTPNPQAATFTPNTDATRSNIGTGPAALRGLAQGGLPRPPARQGSGQFSIQGAANQQAPPQAPAAPVQRGGAQSGIPRGGGGIPRGGRGGAPRGGANAGQKRPHEGGDSGDAKRTRGEGPGGS